MPNSLGSSLLDPRYYVGGTPTIQLGMLISSVTQPYPNTIRLNRIDGTFTDIQINPTLAPGPTGPPGAPGEAGGSITPPSPPTTPPPGYPGTPGAPPEPVPGVYTRPAVDLLTLGFQGEFSGTKTVSANMPLVLVQNTLANDMNAITINLDPAFLPVISEYKTINLISAENHQLTYISADERANGINLGPGSVRKYEVSLKTSFTQFNILNSNPRGLSYGLKDVPYLDPNTGRLSTTYYQYSIPGMYASASIISRDSTPIGDNRKALRVEITPNPENKYIITEFNDTTQQNEQHVYGKPSLVTVTNYTVRIHHDHRTDISTTTPVLIPNGTLSISGQSFFKGQLITLDISGLSAPCSFQISFDALADDCQYWFIDPAYAGDLQSTIGLPYSATGIKYLNSVWYNARSTIVAVINYVLNLDLDHNGVIDPALATALVINPVTLAGTTIQSGDLATVTNLIEIDV